jgi:hypothetical protein
MKFKTNYFLGGAWLAGRRVIAGNKKPALRGQELQHSNVSGIYFLLTKYGER